MIKQRNKHHTNEETLKQASHIPIIISTRDSETPTLTYGPKRLHYQYSAVLPTIHLTLISILQGIAFAVLLLGIPLPNITDSHLFEFLLRQYFYLPYLISSLLILLIWKQFTQACLFSNWPLSALQAGLIYLMTLPEIIAFKVISPSSGTVYAAISPDMLSGWLFGVGWIGIIGGLIRLNNHRLQIEDDYDSLELAEFSLKEEIIYGCLYVGLGVIVASLGATYNYLLTMLAISSKVTSFISWGIMISLMVIVCIVFILDVKHIQKIIEGSLEGSDLKISPQGVLRYDLSITDQQVGEVAEDVRLQQSKEEPSVLHSFSKKIYLYGFVGIFGVIIGGVVAVFLSQNVLKSRK